MVARLALAVSGKARQNALSFGKFWASKWDPALLPTARSKMGWAGVKAVEFGWFLHAVEATKRGQVSSASVQTLG